MSIIYAARILGRAVLLGGAGAAAAIATVFSGYQHPIPAHPPDLLENAPMRELQVAALQRSNPDDPFDLLVIGGGATGTGVALDAATRGLTVALVEREDFSSGTSSRSTKLVHGGVRYLEKALFQGSFAQLKLVFQALNERAHILQNCPYLAKPFPLLTPCYVWWEVPYFWSGLKLYDLIAARKMLFLSKFMSSKSSMDAFPSLSPSHDGKSLKGSVVYYDGLMDDSRLNVMLSVTSARAGAVVVNHADAIALTKDDQTEHVNGAQIMDKITGKIMNVHAKVVVNATGAYSDSIRQLSQPDSPPIIQPSSGTHIVLPGYVSSPTYGLLVPRTKDGRVVFMFPWHGKTVVGTTDIACKVSDVPRAKDEEVSFILDAVRQYLSIDVDKSDILSAWNGIRPLVLTQHDSNQSTSNIVRDHIVTVGSDNLITVTGGKWTTYRSMAEDAVDMAIKIGNLKPISHCITEHVKLTGSENYSPTLFMNIAKNFVRAKPAGWNDVKFVKFDDDMARHLADSFGSRAVQVALIAKNEKLGNRLVHGFPNLEAEVAYCARFEYCETAQDYLSRRSRLAFLDVDAAKRALPRVVEILALEKAWSKARKQAELKQAKAFLNSFKAVKDRVILDQKNFKLKV